MQGNRLRQLREQFGFTQAYIASQFGVGERTVMRWEAGSNDPSAAELARLADMLETSVDYLLGRSDDPGRPQATADKLTPEESRLLRLINQGQIVEAMEVLLNITKSRLANANDSSTDG